MSNDGRWSWKKLEGKEGTQLEFSFCTGQLLLPSGQDSLSPVYDLSTSIFNCDRTCCGTDMNSFEGNRIPIMARLPPEDCIEEPNVPNFT